MAYSLQREVSDGTLQYVNITIQYFDKKDLFVYKDGLVVPKTSDAPSAEWSYVWDGNRIKINKVVPKGSEILVRRKTPYAVPMHVYRQGAVFKDSTMDDNFLQMLFINQENVEGLTATDFYNGLDFHGYRLKNVGAAKVGTDAMPYSQYVADALGAGQNRIAAEQARDTTEGFKAEAQTAMATAKEWANKLGATVDATEYSAKYYSIKANEYSASANNSKDAAAQSASSASASAADAAQLFVSSGASLVGYSPSGAGAIATSVQDKLRETVSVKDFGAVGDGVTDDTTAFTRAAATGKVILIPESDNQYKVAGDFSSYTFVSLGRVDPTNNATIKSSLLGFAYNTKCNDNNIFFIPVGTTKSFAFKGHNEGAMNYWGGDSSGADNPGVGGTGTGITFYGRLHDTYAEEIKLRALNKHPLWFKAQTDFSSEYADFGAPRQIKGFWYAEDFSLMGLDRLQTTGLDVKASAKRVRIDDADMTVGDSTAGTFYEINHRNSSGYLQFDGGQNQGEGFCVRLYGNATGTASTSDGMIWYANNIQQFRYRYDIKQFDFKDNTTKYTPALVSALPSASTQGAGARAFVSDATATTFASIVSGGGSNKVPVYSDGTNWRIG